jgi:hypothetical protein
MSGKANTFPGFTEMIAYTCKHCLAGEWSRDRRW